MNNRTLNLIGCDLIALIMLSLPIHLPYYQVFYEVSRHGNSVCYEFPALEQCRSQEKHYYIGKKSAVEREMLRTTPYGFKYIIYFGD